MDIGSHTVNYFYNSQTQRKKYKFNVPTEKKYPYTKRNLLTKTEYYFYFVLAEAFPGYVICPKVRLEDFVQVTTHNERGKWRGFIKSRHVDFLICDSKMNIRLGVELDDKPHDLKEPTKIDTFKDNLFKQIGIPLLRVKTGTAEHYKQQLTQYVNSTKTT